MNNNVELTLLSEGQIWGNKKEEQLEAIRKYGTKAAISDLCILTGSFLPETRINESKSLRARTSYFWTKSCSSDNDVIVVNKYGHWENTHRFIRRCVIRPIIQSNKIFYSLCYNRVKGYNDTYEVEFLEYPQCAADLRMQKILETAYIKGMNKTGRSYTFDSVKYDDYDTGFKPVTYEEYEYQGKKYIRIRANSNFGGNKFKLSNGACYRNGDYVWVEVSPVRWLIDSKTHTLISKYGLVSGIRFLDRNHEYKGDFSKT